MDFCLPYKADLHRFERRKSLVVSVGDLAMGGQYPIRIQSMCNTDTLDTEGTLSQCERMIAAGCQYIRLTTPTLAAVENLRNIKNQLRRRGHQTPLIADVHFSPGVAEAAAEIVEKVRINPGNYADKKVFAQHNYTDSEYQQEQERIFERLLPLLKICKANRTAIRIGTNHGSLSDRIVSRYGNSPYAMAISAMEYVSICQDFGFHNLVLSMKSSDTRIMVQSVRFLVAMLDEKGWNYPIHLGITEAGSGEYGRIKSAAGIGALLRDGIGDTIRVSLTEKPENELPFASILANLNDDCKSIPIEKKPYINSYNPYFYEKRSTQKVGQIGGKERPVVITSYTPTEKEDVSEKEFSPNENVISAPAQKEVPVVSLRALIDRKNTKPFVFQKCYMQSNWEEFVAAATADIATLGIDGLIDAVQISNPHFEDKRIYHLCLAILQACALRYSKAEFISCPSCGRTQYNIEMVAEQVKKETSHLKGLKIGVMGCIVNGPGEMADADYGVVGSTKNCVTLYKGQQAVKKNIPQENAAQELIALIKENKDWKNQ